MNQQQIKALIDALAGSDLAELEYSENGSTLRLVRQSALAGVGAAKPMVARTSPAVAVAAGIDAPDEPASPAAECLAPIYGVVHLRPSPDAPPFVTVGQQVQAGQALCVIEAMKVFNEVRAEADALLAAVLVEPGDEVEAGQPLFRWA